MNIGLLWEASPAGEEHMEEAGVKGDPTERHGLPAAVDAAELMPQLRSTPKSFKIAVRIPQG